MQLIEEHYHINKMANKYNGWFYENTRTKNLLRKIYTFINKRSAEVNYGTNGEIIKIKPYKIKFTLK